MLQWDAASQWHEVEHARLTWGLPGFVAVDHRGRLRGAAYYLLEHERIDIGSIISDDDRATDVLLAGIMTVAEAMKLAVVRALSLDAAVALRSGLRGHGFDIEPHLYLSRELRIAQVRPSRSDRFWAQPADGPSKALPVIEARPWQADDVEATAALLARAYDRASGSLFAPHHEPEEWSRYVRNLVTHVGCGTLNASATQVVSEGDQILGLALVTHISPGVAHLVQLAVDPSRRGSGLGEALVTGACGALRDSGYRALTLMVAARNTTARALYDRTGFRHDATFLAATVDMDARRERASAPATRATA
jgi:ribosomal protein S18 acetylase RimI-like enzyme